MNPKFETADTFHTLLGWLNADPANIELRFMTLLTSHDEMLRLNPEFTNMLFIPVRIETEDWRRAG